jgi:hypothetical protein
MAACDMSWARENHAALLQRKQRRQKSIHGVHIRLQYGSLEGWSEFESLPIEKVACCTGEQRRESRSSFSRCSCDLYPLVCSGMAALCHLLEVISKSFPTHLCTQKYPLPFEFPYTILLSSIEPVAHLRSASVTCFEVAEMFVSNPQSAAHLVVTIVVLLYLWQKTQRVRRPSRGVHFCLAQLSLWSD